MITIKRPGALHKQMGVPKGQKIPTKDLEATKSRAKKRGDTKTVKRTTFALNARKWDTARGAKGKK